MTKAPTKESNLGSRSLEVGSRVERSAAKEVQYRIRRDRGHLTFILKNQEDDAMDAMDEYICDVWGDCSPSHV